MATEEDKSAKNSLKVPHIEDCMSDPMVSNMSDSQFNASLEAFLDADYLDSTKPDNSPLNLKKSVREIGTVVPLTAAPTSGSESSSIPIESPPASRHLATARVMEPAPVTSSQNYSFENLAFLHRPPSSVIMREGMSVATGDTNTSDSTSMMKSKRKRLADSSEVTSAISEDEGEQERRRQDRNMREQLRSQRITGQISSLKDLLVSSNVQFKPDKFSTLAATGDYIRILQKQSQALTAEHQRLLDTISKTTAIVNEQYVSAQSNDPFSSEVPASDDSPLSPQDELLSLAHGIDFKAIFMCSPFACAVASIDGRFVDCNGEFEKITGYTKEELFPDQNLNEMITETPFSPNKQNMSLFNILNRSDMQKVFEVMSEMLKRPTLKACLAAEDHWFGQVEICRKNGEMVRMALSLIRAPGGRPHYFHCTMLPP